MKCLLCDSGASGTLMYCKKCASGERFSKPEPQYNLKKCKSCQSTFQSPHHHCANCILYKRSIYEPKPKKPNNRIWKASRRKIISMFGNECFWCGTHFTSDLWLTIDHLIPRAKGGKNEISNYVPSCEPCNKKKSDMMPLTFLNRSRK